MSTRKSEKGGKAFENRGPLEINIETLVLHGFPTLTMNKLNFQWKL